MEEQWFIAKYTGMGETRSALTVCKEFILAPNKYICSFSIRCIVRALTWVKMEALIVIQKLPYQHFPSTTLLMRHITIVGIFFRLPAIFQVKTQRLIIS